MQLVKQLPTVEEILTKIEPYDIYKLYLGDFEIGGTICNPWYKQTTPSFGVYMKDSKLYHGDFADPDHHGDCWQLVQQLFNLGKREGVEKVAQDFGLTDSTSTRYKEIVSQYSKPIMDQKRHALLQVTSRRWHKSDFSNYWDRYRVIGEQKLRKHHVHPVKELFLNRRRIPIGKDEMVWGYWYENGWKIMFPERERGKKWLSNVPLDTPGGLKNLNKNQNTLIVKSLKCYMVMEEVYQHLCYMQNESLGSVSDKTAKYINENSKEVWYGGDSDCAGKKASYKITDKFQWHHINTPDRLLPAKDWSDWVELEDINPVKKHLEIKGIIV